jgi:hypothetical protein
MGTMTVIDFKPKKQKKKKKEKQKNQQKNRYIYQNQQIMVKCIVVL